MKLRLLIDSCVALAVLRAVRQAGHDATWVGEWLRDPGDRAILQHAVAEQRIVVTRDQDFATLVFRDGLRHTGLLKLSGNGSYHEQALAVMQALDRYADILAQGGYVIVEQERVRIVTIKSETIN
jgi:predicted nuclease of predicted toxin-antitoxin system